MQSYVEVSARQWPKDAEVTLCSVPWDNTYRDIVQFDNVSARDNYLKQTAVNRYIIPNNTTIRPGRPIIIGLPYNAVQGCNYLVLQLGKNPIPNDTPASYCYFIENMDYVSPHSTQLTLQLDVWSTYQFWCDFGYSFVERGHIGIANSNATLEPSSMRKYFDVPEGLDTGSQMAVVAQTFDNFGSDGWTAILSITNDLSKNPGTVDNPTSKTASGTQVDNLISAANIYAVDNGIEMAMLIAGLGDRGWIGRNVQALYLMPTKFVQKGSDEKIHEEYSFIQTIHAYLPRSKNLTINAGDLVGKLSDAIPARYKQLKKLCAYPFSCISASNQAGANTLYKPQFLQSRTCNFITHSVVLAPFSRVMAYLDGYNAQGSSDIKSRWTVPSGMASEDITVDGGDWIDNAIVFDDWPQFSILNDSYSTYLASNAHSRAYSYDAAGWSRDKAQMGADLTYETAQKQMETQKKKNAVNNAAQVTQGVVGAAFTSASGSKNAGAQAAGQLASTGINLAANLATQKLDLDQQAWEADKNYQLQNATIKGDYANTIAGINATVQDAQITSPAIAGAAGGMGFNLSQGFIGLRVTAKMISTGALAVVGEYWLRYGYAVRRFLHVPQKLVCMNHFAYWKLQDCYLKCPRGTEVDRQAIRAIFSKGVTVWSNPDEIGNIDPANNTAKSGYSY